MDITNSITHVLIFLFSRYRSCDVGGVMYFGNLLQYDHSLGNILPHSLIHSYTELTMAKL